MPLGYTLSARDVLHYYGEDLCVEMFKLAKGRRVIMALSDQAFRSGRDRIPVTIRQPEDFSKAVAPIIATDPNPACLRRYPAFHATIGRYPGFGVRVKTLDFVLDADTKYSGKAGQAMMRAAVGLLEEMNAFYWAKFTGGTGCHIVIPSEAIPKVVDGVSFQRKTLYGRLNSLLVRKIRKEAKPYLRGGSHFDTFVRDHMLRLPYSINEDTGLAAIPVLPDDLDTFSMRKAEIQNVDIVQGWAEIPQDAESLNKPLIAKALGLKR